MRGSTHLFAPLLMLAGAVAVRILDPALVTELRARAFDGFQSLQPRVHEDTPVRVVTIDDDSLKRHGQWPWPRTVLAKLVEKLQDAGAAAIAFDVIFAEPDRTSPNRVLAGLPPTPATRALIEAAAAGSLPDHDVVFAEAIGRGGVVTSFALSRKEGAALPLRKAAVSVVGESPLAYVPSTSYAVATLEELSSAADGDGSVSVIKDGDAIIRRVPLVVAVNDELFPSLAVEALRVAQGVPGIVVKVSGSANVEGSGGDTGVQAVKVGELVLPTDPRGALLLYDTTAVSERFVPAWEVLDDGFDASRVDGRIVFVGATGVGLYDVHATPLHPALPGVVQHALVAEQAFQQSFLTRPAWADGAEILSVFFAGLSVLLTFLLARGGARWGAVVGFLVMPATIGSAWYAFSAHRLLLDPFMPSITALLVYSSATVASWLKSEGERRFVRNAFAHYLSPALVDQIAANPERLKLGGEEREITVAFSDIRGFTSLSERLGAEGIARLLNRYLTRMTNVILDHGGTIDKYIGDAIMCFWNAPLDSFDHPHRACRAALAMLGQLGDLNRELSDPNATTAGVRIKIGLGITTGRCSVGNMGADQRFDYTAIGDTVNLASRLEGQSKTYGVGIVLGESTAGAVQDLALLEIDLLRVVGKLTPERIFALLGDEKIRADDGFYALEAEHRAMLAAYRSRRWAEAAERVAACRAQATGFALDPLYDLYAERIAGYTADEPPPEWSGVHSAITK